MKPSFNNLNIKPKPMDRSNPGPSKTGRRSRASSSDKTEDYGSTKNATDERTVGALRGAGGAKPKPRATAATEGHNTRSKTATAVDARSCEGGVPESENNADNAGCRKRGGTGAAPKESGRKSSPWPGGSIARRLRNSECSKEGSPTQKGRAAEGGVTGGTAAASGNPLPPRPRRAKLVPSNPFNKPSVATLKKSGESFLQVK